MKPHSGAFLFSKHMWYDSKMDIQIRKQEATQKFEELKAEREEHLKAAETNLTEMTMLQGEYRLLEKLEKDENKKNKKANVIEVEETK